MARLFSDQRALFGTNKDQRKEIIYQLKITDVDKL